MFVFPEIDYLLMHSSFPPHPALRNSGITVWGPPTFLWSEFCEPSPVNHGLQDLRMRLGELSTRRRGIVSIKVVSFIIRYTGLRLKSTCLIQEFFYCLCTVHGRILNIGISDNGRCLEMPSLQAFHSSMAASCTHRLTLLLLLPPCTLLLLGSSTHEFFTFSGPFLLAYPRSHCPIGNFKLLFPWLEILFTLQYFRNMFKCCLLSEIDISLMILSKVTTHGPRSIVLCFSCSACLPLCYTLCDLSDSVYFFSWKFHEGENFMLLTMYGFSVPDI